MPRTRLLPENNARQGSRSPSSSRRSVGGYPDLTDAVQFIFVTGWRSRFEVVPLTWAQIDFVGGFVSQADLEEAARRIAGRAASVTFGHVRPRRPDNPSCNCKDGGQGRD